MDRMIGLYLNEVAPIITSATASSTSAQPPNADTRYSRVTPRTNTALIADQSIAPRSSSGLGEALLDVLENANNLTSIAQAYQSYFKSDALWSDKVLALGGGLASILSSSELPPVSEFGDALGGVVGIGSVAADITVELTDLWAMGTPALQQTAYDDLQSTNGNLLLNSLQTGFAAVLAGSGAGLLGPYAAELYATLENNTSAGVVFQGGSLITNIVQLNFGDELQTALNAASQQLLNPFTSISQGIAEISGTIGIPDYFSSGAFTPGLQNLFNQLNEVSVSSNGTAFTTIADPVGNFTSFLSLQIPSFNYGAANLQVLDPLTQLILNTLDLKGGQGESSQIIDLSKLTTTAPLKLPMVNVLMNFTECIEVWNIACYTQCNDIYAPSNGNWNILGLEGCENACNTAYNACVAPLSVGASTLARETSRTLERRR